VQHINAGMSAADDKAKFKGASHRLCSLSNNACNRILVTVKRAPSSLYLWSVLKQPMLRMLKLLLPPLDIVVAAAAAAAAARLATACCPAVPCLVMRCGTRRTCSGRAGPSTTDPAR
jgi:hypothetical protein